MTDRKPVLRRLQRQCHLLSVGVELRQLRLTVRLWVLQHQLGLHPVQQRLQAERQWRLSKCAPFNLFAFLYAPTSEHRLRTGARSPRVDRVPLVGGWGLQKLRLPAKFSML